LELFREHGSVERKNDCGRPNKRTTEAAGKARQIIEIATSIGRVSQQLNLLLSFGTTRVVPNKLVKINK
jgi:hypothetical protein